ncbi:hypothetical protein [Shewanella algae]|uniref:hypothetical protein n=1 Tax=Shewanella algae TaxID=38313 RepID=UPI000B8B60AB|nr:hypothetical protein [Shewanella algae]OXS01010.1 hypothetical protein AMR44_09965 [Shewanella algae]
MSKSSSKSPILKLAATLTAIAALLHLAIIPGGAEWYRLFGAGEAMAQMSENDSTYPAMVTAAIALILAGFSAFGFSGAGVIRPLPLLKTTLVLISGIFLARGLLGIPLVLLGNSPYLTELAGQMSFMLLTSAISFREGANKSSWHSGLHSNWRSRHLTEGMPGQVEVG